MERFALTKYGNIVDTSTMNDAEKLCFKYGYMSNVIKWSNNKEELEKVKE